MALLFTGWPPKIDRWNVFDFAIVAAGFIRRGLDPDGALTLTLTLTLTLIPGGARS